MLILRLVQRYKIIRSAFAYSWLIALAGSLAAWLLVLLSAASPGNPHTPGQLAPGNVFPRLADNPGGFRFPGLLHWL